VRGHGPRPDALERRRFSSRVVVLAADRHRHQIGRATATGQRA
jgi:hypothetical protein